MKICKTCNKDKDNFHKESRSDDGLQSSCKECMKKKFDAYGRTDEGLAYRIYYSQVQRSKKRGHNPPSYTKEELYNWLIHETDYLSFIYIWKHFGYSKDFRPSVDRIDDYLGYNMNNIRLTTWKANNERGRLDTKNGINNKRNISVIQYTKKGDKMKEFHSAHQASRETGANVSHIVACCKGRYGRKSAGGYIWKYKDES